MAAKSPETDFVIFNTLTKQKETFKPIQPGHVSMYVCGVTSYDYSHIGHARAYVAFDVLYRFLKHLDYEVKYVRNFTDVDDKIINRANENQEDPLALSARFCKEFMIDMTDLQCLPPTEQPTVSGHMDQIRDMIAKIIDNGCAYVVGNDVFFSVEKSPNYGCLSGRKLEDNRSGERVAIDPRKKHPADFALWKVTKLYHPLALRHFLMGTHYRSPVNYSIAQIEISSEAIFYIYQTLEDCAGVISQFKEEIEASTKKFPVTADAKTCITNLKAHFKERLSDDLHTPTILNASLQDALRLFNKILSNLKKKLQKPQKFSNVQSLIDLEKEVKIVLDVLGLLSDSTYTEVLNQLKEKALKRANLTEEDILKRIEERSSARKNKDFSLSDQIRKDLTFKGIALMDVGEDTIWRPCVPVEPAVSTNGQLSGPPDGQQQELPKSADTVKS
ncbi:cysteinyl-tRNA synthetase, class Ia family protein [Artemisia annua]|uniref:Cysteinyl-tRNA synthetase, class Ia family protein n=1 Tax=Artemisia annua TaxID=35608 RepID=A0A2U1Q5Z8_ARTAN|nr:cysteinyl-tRNA synthetase, class Ia family protein [Artemisia annua]